MKLTPEQHRRLAELKREASQPKGVLIRILQEVEKINASEALRLVHAIDAIESWQNKGRRM